VEPYWVHPLPLSRTALTPQAVTASGELSALTTHLTSPPHDAVYALRSSELAYIPIDPVSVLAEGEAGEGDGVSEDKAEGVLRLVELLEDEPEVVKVWTNLAE
jgi:transcriptional/translational regulatory protein YebC/TACO1